MKATVIATLKEAASAGIHHRCTMWLSATGAKRFM